MHHTQYDWMGDMNKAWSQKQELKIVLKEDEEVQKVNPEDSVSAVNGKK